MSPADLPRLVRSPRGIDIISYMLVSVLVCMIELFSSDRLHRSGGIDQSRSTRCCDNDFVGAEFGK